MKIIPAESRRSCDEMFNSISAGPQTFHVVNYDSLPNAVADLRTGFVRGVVDIPPDFSRRYYQHDRPRIAFTEDNSDQFISSSLLERIQEVMADTIERRPTCSRASMARCS